MTRDPRGPFRTVVSATYTRASDRTDDGGHVSGDVTYVTFAECDHVMLGNPIMTYRPGTSVRCFACGQEADDIDPDLPPSGGQFPGRRVTL